jgi:hypothetical protein
MMKCRAATDAKPTGTRCPMALATAIHLRHAAAIPTLRPIEINGTASPEFEP